MALDLSAGRHGSSETKKRSPIKNLLRSLRISVGHRKPAKTSAVGDSKVQRSIPISNRRSGSNTRERKVRASSQHESTPSKRSVSRTVAIERPSTPQNQVSRSPGGSFSTTVVTQTPQSSRSSPSSRLAFTRSQSKPGHQRVVRRSDSHHKRGTSAIYVQEGRIQDRGLEAGEVSRGRKSEQSPASKIVPRQAEDRTPSPPALDRTPSGTPCSNASDEPTTPILTRRDLRVDLQIDTKPSAAVAAGMLSSLPEVAEDTVEVPASDADVFDCPEDFYRLPSSGYYGAKARDSNQQGLYTDYKIVMKHRNVATKHTLPDGSQLHSVSTRKPFLARPTSTMSTIPIMDQTSPGFQSAHPPWSAGQESDVMPIQLAQASEKQPPLFRLPQQAFSPIGELAPLPDMIEVSKTSSRAFIPGPNVLPRKPVSYERLRPVSVDLHGSLPSLPEQMPPHRRTRSDMSPPTGPSPRSQPRSATMYSYTPTHDTRADRRSYNTLRFLDSQGQNHERLRQVLGI